MKVDVVNIRRQSRADRHGWKADFKIKEPTKNLVIYQNIHVSIKTIDKKGEVDKEKYSFTEAWKYSSKRQITDSFLIPLDWRQNVKGSLTIKAVIWSEDGQMNKKLKKGSNFEYWGNLYGSFDLLTPSCPVTKRQFVAEWDNIGKNAKTHFTNGKDLKLVTDTVT